MSENQTNLLSANPETPTQYEQPVQGEDTTWIEPYYKMSKEELLENVDSTTLNQIRNTLGDQQFIDQWKLSEADYNQIIEGDNQAIP